ncbi:hypothetical protein ElyMa_007055500 [Elysia marginata]|uniref:Uncharacterized protein n=1 Tax=Elysia marginata TaxID=1093978 RepID=A0AAV4JXP3_9GAST|nr:hypothetical protein ElyMa_007055500 [Elysia marginata]
MLKMLELSFLAETASFPSVPGAGTGSEDKKGEMQCETIRSDDEHVAFFIDFMRWRPTQEDEAHSGGNPRWLMGYQGPSANRLL